MVITLSVAGASLIFCSNPVALTTLTSGRTLSSFAKSGKFIKIAAQIENFNALFTKTPYKNLMHILLKLNNRYQYHM